MINLTKSDQVARVMSDSYYSAAELYIIFFKKKQMGPGDEGLVLIPAFIDFRSPSPPFFSSPVCGKASGWERRRQLWESLPLNKNGEARGTKVRCCMNNNRFCCCCFFCSPDALRASRCRTAPPPLFWSATAAKLPSPNESPELLNFCRVDVRDTKRRAGSAWKLA